MVVNRRYLINITKELYHLTGIPRRLCSRSLTFGYGDFPSQSEYPLLSREDSMIWEFMSCRSMLVSVFM